MESRQGKEVGPGQANRAKAHWVATLKLVRKGIQERMGVSDPAAGITATPTSRATLPSPAIPTASNRQMLSLSWTPEKPGVVTGSLSSIFSHLSL